MAYEKDPKELGALWLRVSKKGTKFLSGKVNGVDVLVFKNDNKRNPKAPDYRVMKSEPRESEASVSEREDW